MRPVIALLLCLSAVPAFAQSRTTQSGTATRGVNSMFTILPAGPGQVVATLTWDVAGANLVMAMACGSTEPLVYAIAAGIQDRVARFEAGVSGSEACAIAVSSIDQTSTFRLHVMKTGDQAVNPSVSPAGFVQFSASRGGTLVGDVAARALARLIETLPSMR